MEKGAAGLSTALLQPHSSFATDDDDGDGRDPSVDGRSLVDLVTRGDVTGRAMPGPVTK